MGIGKIYRPKEFDELMGWSASTRKRKIAAGEIRPPIKLGPNMRGFTEEYIKELREQLIEAAEREAAES